MHEAALMQAALDVALKHARREGAGRIHRMTLRVGASSGVVPDALSFAFEALTPGTPAEGARLELKTVPVLCHCSRCDEDFRPADVIYACPRCGTISGDVRQGWELELVSLEVS